MTTILSILALGGTLVAASDGPHSWALNAAGLAVAAVSFAALAWHYYAKRQRDERRARFLDSIRSTGALS